MKKQKNNHRTNFLPWMLVCLAGFAMVSQPAEAKLKKVNKSSAILEDTVWNPIGGGGGGSQDKCEMEYYICCEGHPTLITKDGSGNTQVYINYDAESGTYCPKEEKYRVVPDAEDRAAGITSINWSKVGIYAGLYVKGEDQKSCQSTYIRMEDGAVYGINIVGIRDGGGKATVTGNARLEIVKGTLHQLSVENEYNNDVQGKIYVSLDQVTLHGEMSINNEGQNTSLYLGPNYSSSYISRSLSQCDGALVWTNSTTLYAVGNAEVPFENAFYTCESMIDDSRSMSFPNGTSIYIKDSEGWSSSVNQNFNTYNGHISKGILYISDIKISGASKGDGSGAAQYGLTGYGYSLASGDLNDGTGGWWVYIGYKTTTDPSKAITDIIMVNGSGYLSDDSFLESNGSKYVLHNGKRYYKNPGYNTYDFNAGAGGAYITLFYTRDGNTNEGQSLLTAFSGGGGAPSGWNYVQEWYGSSGDGTAFSGYTSGTGNTNRGTGSKTPNYYVYYYAGHTHAFDHYEEIGAVKSGKCSCGMTLTTNGLIYYSSFDHSMIDFGPMIGFGANCISNFYDPETDQGVLTFDGPVTSIPEGPFINQDALTSITIPNTVTKIELYAFYGSNNLTSITNCANAPQRNSALFQPGNYNNVSLYVPGPSLATYRSTSGWSSFQNIQCIEGTHDFHKRGEILSEPTCSEEGSCYALCRYCDASTSDILTIPATGQHELDINGNCTVCGTHYRTVESIIYRMALNGVTVKVTQGGFYEWDIDANGKLTSTNTGWVSDPSETTIAFICPHDFRLSFDYEAIVANHKGTLTISLDGETIADDSGGSYSNANLTAGTHLLSLKYERGLFVGGPECASIWNISAASTYDHVWDQNSYMELISTHEVSCTNLAYSDYQCSVCGKIVRFANGEMLPHTFAADDVTRSECTVCHHGLLRYHSTDNAVVVPFAPTQLLDAEGNKLNIFSNGYVASENQCVLEFTSPLVTIGEGAFQGCTGFNGSLTIPGSVITIGKDAFKGCENVDILLLSIPEVGEDALANIGSVEVRLTDRSSVTTQEIEFEVDQVSYTRQMASQWGSLTVPFALTVSENDAYDLFTLNAAYGSAVSLTKVNSGTTIPAGTPLFVRMKEERTEGYQLAIVQEDCSLTTTPNDGAIAKGTYWNTDVTGVNGYILANDEFWNIQQIKGSNTVWVAPFRSFLLLPNNATKMRIEIDAEETAIEQTAAEETDGIWYNLQGQRLHAPQKGIHIQRGKKTL